MPKEQNQYNIVAQKSLTSQIKILRAYRFSLVTKKHGLAAEAALKAFLQTWADEGWETAIDGIPKDNPNTREDEGMTYEQMNEEAEYVFGKPLDEVDITGQDDYETYLKNITDRIRAIIGQQYQLDSMIGNAERELADLRSIASSESADIKY